MARPIIEVANISKSYTIGRKESYGSLRDEIMQALTSPFRRKGPSGSEESGDTIWALKDVSFKVEEGEVLGIIGRNGAGKSTLLKVLSRISEPTRGRITMRGRVASLLEVGTGFHPELTGRENIFLNGALLGMTSSEIRSKFDEIVAFSEIEKFLDTPVKRYSSGMHVRLAFAVAAHLEPEILIVDEVLAVGDAAFQKKCLGKMGNVARGGRTVLFVSHNMGAIVQLCGRCILLNGGQIAFNGDTNKATRLYLQAGRRKNIINKNNFIGSLKSKIEFNNVIINGHSEEFVEISPSSDITIVIEGCCSELIPKFRTSIVIFKDGFRICTLHDSKNPEPMQKGYFASEVKIPRYFLRPGEYFIAVGGHDGGTLAPGMEWIFGSEVASFDVTEEWSDNNDFANIGVVNLPHVGQRKFSKHPDLQIKK